MQACHIIHLTNVIYHDFLRTHIHTQFEATENDQDERALMRDCSGNQKYFRLDLTTDNYGFEDTWDLLRLQGNVWRQVQSGPPNQTKYASNSRFVGGEIIYMMWYTCTFI